MKRGNCILTACLLAATFAYGQQGFYETLESNGSDAIYTEYYRAIDPDKDGKYQLEGLGPEFNIRVLKMVTGEKIGFETHSEADTPALSGVRSDVVESSDSLIGFPETYMFYDKRNSDGNVLIGDYLFQLDGVDLDNSTYEYLSGVFILKGSGDTGEVAAEKSEEGGKKGLKGKLKSLKSKLETAGVPPDAAKFMKIDARTMIEDYLKAMKKKDEAHQKTPAEMKEWQKILAGPEAYAQEVKDYNKNLRTGPEYHRVIQNNSTAQKVEDSENHIALYGDDSRVEQCTYTLVNDGSSTFTYVISGGATGTIDAGAEQEFSCYYVTFFSEGTNKGERICGGGMGAEGQRISVSQ